MKNNDDKLAVIFDLDGVLIHEDERVVSIRSPNGIRLRDWYMVETVSACIPIREYDGVEQRMASRYNRTVELGDAELMFKLNKWLIEVEEEEHENCVIFPDTIHTLKTLKGDGYKIGIATNTSEIEYLKISERFGFGGYIDEYVTRNMFGYIKPHAQPLVRLIKKLDVKESVYIDDDYHGAESFRAACEIVGIGGAFVLANTKGYDNLTIESIRPNAVIHSPGEILPILPSLV